MRDARATAPRPRAGRGFTLIELLIVVAIIGIISAVAIPNLLNAIDRGKQKRTMADLRNVGTTVETYAIDNTYYPVQASEAAISASSLVGQIDPQYITHLPTVDGWQFDLRYQSDGVRYTAGSLGKDGAAGGTLAVIGTGGPTTDFDCDILFSYGAFVQWPEGTQTD